MLRFVLIFAALLTFASQPPATAEPLRVVAVLADDGALAGAHDVELQGRYAYVCGKGGSLSVIDVVDPTRPKIVWSQRDLSRYEDPEVVHVVGQTLYLGSRDFASFDVTDPERVRPLGSLADRRQIDRLNGFARRDKWIFAANKEGRIVAFDVGRPERPELFGSLDVAARDGLGKPHDAAWLGEHLAVVDPAGFGRRETPGQIGVYQVFDAETKAALPADRWRLLGRAASSQLVGGNRIRTIGKFAFVAASISPQATNRERKRPGLAIVDFTNMADAQVAAWVAFADDRGPNGIEVAGNVVFLSGGQTVAAVDVSDPRRPELLASLRAVELFRGDPGNDDGHDLVYRNGYLYLTGQTSHSFGVVQVVDDRIRKLAEQRN